MEFYHISLQLADIIEVEWYAKIRYEQLSQTAAHLEQDQLQPGEGFDSIHSKCVDVIMTSYK
jgi:hypothetical protein